jgi:hypothetical protein
LEPFVVGILFACSVWFGFDFKANCTGLQIQMVVVRVTELEQQQQAQLNRFFNKWPHAEQTPICIICFGS